MRYSGNQGEPMKHTYIQTTNAVVESVLIPQQKLKVLTPTPLTLNNCFLFFGQTTE